MKTKFGIWVALTLGWAIMGLTACDSEKAAGKTEHPAAVEKSMDEAKSAEHPAEKPAQSKPKDHPAH